MDAVYDVLKTRTSEKNGDAADPTGSDVTAGIVRVSARSTPDANIAERKIERTGVFMGSLAFSS